MHLSGLRELALQHFKPAGKAAQAGLGAFTPSPDGRFIRRTREGEQAAARNRPQHHRADDGAAAARHLAHVKHMVLTAVGAHDLQQRGAVGAAIAHLHALLRGEAAVAGADDPGAGRRAHAVADLACGLQQLR